MALRIGEVAERAGVTPDTLRYYERIGMLARARRSSGGYRLWDRSVVDRVVFIRKAQALGLTLDEISEVLALSTQGTEPCPHVRSALSHRLQEVESRLADLRSLRATLMAALSRSQHVPTADHCICGIIESQEIPAEVPRDPAKRTGNDSRSRRVK
ncbi:MAG: heavy metal-responsive transcriptional regulator [Gemmatimonadetes bacterium]|nr:heavy metal-responsive transcriptional regulator [Gemmatimonadota bacterium]